MSFRQIPSVPEAIIRAFCFLGREIEIHFHWRPFLPDPGDEFILELVVAGRAAAICHPQCYDFTGADRFAIKVLTPRDFLGKIGKEGL